MDHNDSSESSDQPCSTGGESSQADIEAAIESIEQGLADTGPGSWNANPEARQRRADARAARLLLSTKARLARLDPTSREATQAEVEAAIRRRERRLARSARTGPVDRNTDTHSGPGDTPGVLASASRASKALGVVLLACVVVVAMLTVTPLGVSFAASQTTPAEDFGDASEYSLTRQVATAASGLLGMANSSEPTRQPSPSGTPTATPRPPTETPSTPDGAETTPTAASERTDGPPSLSSSRETATEAGGERPDESVTSATSPPETNPSTPSSTGNAKTNENTSSVAGDGRPSPVDDRPNGARDGSNLDVSTPNGGDVEKPEKADPNPDDHSSTADADSFTDERDSATEGDPATSEADTPEETDDADPTERHPGRANRSKSGRNDGSSNGATGKSKPRTPTPTAPAT